MRDIALALPGADRLAVGAGLVVEAVRRCLEEVALEGGVLGSGAPYDLATWRTACDCLASFAGLQQLTVHLDHLVGWRAG